MLYHRLPDAIADPDCNARLAKVTVFTAFDRARDETHAEIAPEGAGRELEFAR